MVANRLFILAVSLGSITSLLSILALSLNYWQGNILTGEELTEIFQHYQNVPQKHAKESQNKTGSSFKDMKDTFTMEKSVGSTWSGALINVHGGIWNFCVKLIEMPSLPGLTIPEFCIYLENVPMVYFPIPFVWVEADWHAPRVLLFLGLFGVIGSIACVLARWFVMLENRVLLSVAAGLTFTAGVFFMAAFSVFADTMKLEFLYYQSAFYFCILSWLLSWATGGVIIRSSHSKYDYFQEKMQQIRRGIESAQRSTEMSEIRNFVTDCVEYDNVI